MRPKSPSKRRVAGVDLAAGRGATAVAVLTCAGDAVLPTFDPTRHRPVRTDDDILAALADADPDVVAIDAPLSLPAPVAAALCSRPQAPAPGASAYTRAAERDPIWSAIGVRPLPVSFLGGLTFRAIALLPRLRTVLPHAAVIEVFPTATLRALGVTTRDPRSGRQPKTSQASRETVQAGLQAFIAGMPSPSDRLLDADLLDALAAALTAALTAAHHLTGATFAVGDPDEGQIVLPRRAVA